MNSFSGPKTSRDFRETGPRTPSVGREKGNGYAALSPSFDAKFRSNFVLNAGRNLQITKK